MDLKQLKHNIEAGNEIHDLLFFEDSKDENSHFVCLQYINGIIKNSSLNVCRVTSIDELISLKASNLFGSDNSLVICQIDLLDTMIDRITDAIVVCNRVSNKIKGSIDIIEFDKIPKWCLEDYILSVCSELSQEDAQFLMEACKENLFRLENELDKICLFNGDNLTSLFKDLKSDYYVDNTNANSMFDFANSIINRDFKNLARLWHMVDFFDSDPMWLLSILISQYKTMIDVFLHPNSTPDYCKISQKRFNAIKFYNKNYSREQLINTYMFLNEVDSNLKSGLLSDINLLDYIVIGVLYRGGEIV